MSERSRIPFSLSPLLLALATGGALAQAVAAEASKRLAPVQLQGQAARPADGLQGPQSTASRLDLSPLEIAASLETLEVARLRARGDAAVSELVGRATGISAMASPGSGSTYASRGFSGNDSVAQAEDGLRMATASGTQSGPSDSWGYERIELLRGPASVLFGDGAIGGLLNLVRKSPQRQARTELEAGLGSEGEYRLGLGLNRPLSERTALRLDALAKGGDGAMARGEHRQRKLMSTWRWEPSEALRLDLSLDVHRERPSAYFGTPLKPDGSLWRELRRENYNVEDALWRMDQERARLRLDWQLAPELSLRSQAYRFLADRRWRNLEEYAATADGRQIERQGYLGIAHQLRQSGLRSELQGRAGAAGQLQWVAGVELTRLDFEHANDLYDYNTVTRVPLQDFDPGRYVVREPVLPRQRSEMRQHALFLEGDWQPLAGWHLAAGLRQDRSRVAREVLSPKPDAWSGRFSPDSWRLGLVFQPDAAQSVYAQYSSGSDPVGTIATLSKANRELRPTEGRQFELGYKRAGRSLEWSAALFQIRKEHILTRNPERPSESVQGGSQRSRGLELSARWLPAPAWRVDANASWLQARYLALSSVVNQQLVSYAGNRAANAPERQANLWLGYQQPAWEAGLGLRHVGLRYTGTSNSRSMPAYTVLDASLGWRLSERSRLRLQLRNLGDKLYASSAYTDSQVLLGRPRSADLVLEQRFE